MSDYAYENTRRIVYGDAASEYGGAVFIPICRTCGRYVRADERMRFTVTPGSWVETVEPVEPNATCKGCGRISMIFEGFS